MEKEEKKKAVEEEKEGSGTVSGRRKKMREKTGENAQPHKVKVSVLLAGSKQQCCRTSQSQRRYTVQGLWVLFSILVNMHSGVMQQA